MKPFLGIDLTNNKNNEELNGNEFLVQEPSLAFSESFEAAQEVSNATIEKSKIPLPFRILRYASGFTALLIASSLAKADVSLAEGYQNAPTFYWLLPICTIVWFVLLLWSRKKSKTLLTSTESTIAFSNLDHTMDAIFDDLSVPTDAPSVDILSFFYKIKDGNIKVATKGLQIAQFFNPVFKIFVDTQNLYLANLEGKYAFPLTSIIGFQTIKKRISINGWNKDEAYNKGIYKKYKLKTNDYGSVFCKYYHILEIDYQGETLGIYIPCYEAPVFEELIKEKA